MGSLPSSKSISIFHDRCSVVRFENYTDFSLPLKRNEVFSISPSDLHNLLKNNVNERVSLLVVEFRQSPNSRDVPCLWLPIFKMIKKQKDFVIETNIQTVDSRFENNKYIHLGVKFLTTSLNVKEYDRLLIYVHESGSEK